MGKKKHSALGTRYEKRPVKFDKSSRIWEGKEWRLRKEAESNAGLAKMSEINEKSSFFV